MQEQGDTLQPGTLLHGGTYRIIRYISAGGFGCTYEAEHLLLQARVAIKEFFINDICNRDDATGHVSVGTKSKVEMFDKLRGKFLGEARSVFKLNHPGIVHVSDVFEENGTAYFVMDYIDGCSLADLIRQHGAMDEQTALGYMRQVCAALDYVHANARLHLDIKPGNIMVDRSGRAILIDFGASKQYDSGTGENLSTLLGFTPGFAPPEQMTADVSKFLPATDVYALGATLYNLLTGEAPLSANMRFAGDRNKPLPATVSAGTRNAVESALQLDRNARPQSVAKFAAMLFGGAGQPQTYTPQPAPQPIPQPVATPPTPPSNPSKGETVVLGQSRPARPWYRRYGIAIAIAAIVIVGAVVAMLRGGGESAAVAADTVATIAVADSLDDAALPSVAVADTAPAKEEPAATPAVQQESQAVAQTSASTAATGSHNGHDYVDLGLSVKWATCNVGASTAGAYGDYFAWGETTTKSEYTKDNSRTYERDINDIAGNSSYDAARAIWGGSWRMPTKHEFIELIDRCTWKWTTQNGHNGYKVTSPNGSSIFLPAAGGRNESSLYGAGTWGEYWSSSPDWERFSWYLSLNSSNRSVITSRRYWAHTIRPVME